MKEIAKTKDEELIRLSKWSNEELFQKLDSLFATLYSANFQTAYDNIIQFFDEGLFGFCPRLKQQLEEAEDLINESSDESSSYNVEEGEYEEEEDSEQEVSTEDEEN